MAEIILEPELPIIDPHHHLWDGLDKLAAFLPPMHFTQIINKTPRYLLPDLLADIGAGHNILGTVYMECRAMYRSDGPDEEKSLGETEFVNGVAAMSASGLYGPARACAGIVGHVDLRLGARAQKLLEAHIAAGNGRFRGVRHAAAHDDDSYVWGFGQGYGLYLDSHFRQGFSFLSNLGLTFDAWLLEPQLPDLIDLAKAFPDTTIVLDHFGTPMGVGRHQGKLAERFDIWRNNMKALAKLPNVFAKVGGLFLTNEPRFDERAPSSDVLAQEWKPYFDTTIEAFGVERCMFESNYPVDRVNGEYATLWNAFKRYAANFSKSEKAALFSETARKVYRLTI